MPQTEIHNPFFFYRGRRFEALVGTRSQYDHSFGAAGGFTVSGQPPGQRGLHQLMTLDMRDPLLAEIFSGTARLPFFYGFHYQSGEVRYQLMNNASVVITELDQESYDEAWPYPGYPSRLPVLPITLDEPTSCTLSEFEEEVWQGIPASHADQFIAVVPPSDAYGVNLWLPESNIDTIHIKCFVDPQTRSVEIYNECD